MRGEDKEEREKGKGRLDAIIRQVQVVVYNLGEGLGRLVVFCWGGGGDSVIIQKGDGCGY